MYDDGLAFHHAFQDLPTAFGAMNADGYASFAISVTGADDGYREAFLPIFAQQQLLAGNLVA